MSKGVPASGIRMTQARKEALAVNPNLTMEDLATVRKAFPAQYKNNSPKNLNAPRVHIPKMNFVEPDSDETDEQIEARLNARFDAVSALTQSCVDGETRSLIISGPAGLGKSWSVETKIAKAGLDSKHYTIVKGYVRATGLIKLLYQHRHEGHVLVMDDADAIYYDDTSLGLLKAVCDTTQKRTVSWLSESNLVDDVSSERIPRTFVFNGTVVFLTNLDFDAMIARGHKLAPHLEALMSRSHYVDLGMKSKRDYLVRIKQVVRSGMLSDLTDREKGDVLEYIEANQDRLRELSLRMAIKIGALRKNNAKWRQLADVTCCRNAPI